jgi:hypothetical protein
LLPLSCSSPVLSMPSAHIFLPHSDLDTFFHSPLFSPHLPTSHAPSLSQTCFVLPWLLAWFTLTKDVTLG